MELPIIPEGTWDIESLSPEPFSLHAVYSTESLGRVLVLADSTRLELLRETGGRRVPLVPAMNYRLVEEVDEEELIQLLRDIQTTVDRIRTTMDESMDTTPMRARVSRSLRSFVDRVNGR